MAVSDEELAQLLQLGFDLETSKWALLNTNSVEEAIERILSGSQPHNPVLHLGLDPIQEPEENDQTPPRGDIPREVSSKEDNSNANVPSRYDTSSKDKEYQKTALKLAAEMKRNKAMEQEAHRRALQQIHEDRETLKTRSQHKVVKLNERPDPVNAVPPSLQADSSSAGKTQTASEHSQSKLAKQSERDARRRVLLDIEDDKRNRKGNIFTTPTATQPSSSNAKQTSTSSADNALIQFRAPDGRMERKLFSANDTIENILGYASTIMTVAGNQLELGVLQMSTTFPRRTFTVADKATTAREAGFVPSCTLNLSMIPSQTSQPPQTDAISANHLVPSNASMNLDRESTSNDNDTDDEEMEIDRDLTRRTVTRGRRAMPNRGRRARGGRGARRGGGALFRGQGRTLVDDNEGMAAERVDNSTLAVNNQSAEDREMIRQLRSRLHGNKVRLGDKATEPSAKVVIQRELPTLRDLCTSAVAVFLTSPTKQRSDYLKSLDQVSPEIAELLLNHLIKLGKLDRTVLKRLTSHCYLQNCVFNAYPYATDSLIEELCRSASSLSIKKLSLSGCDIITNAGIQNIHTLKHLEFLDLSNCKATDRSLEALKKLPCLVHLYMSKTKITSRGLRSFTEVALCRDKLQTLVLNGCAGVNSPDIFSLLAKFPNLLHLNLSSLDLPSPCDVPIGSIFTTLQVLDVSNTGIGDTEVMRILSRMKQLLEIKLTGCRSISVSALSFLGRELSNLEDIKFPNQNQDLNDCLVHYGRLNLTHLNLGNYKEIDDSGMQHIAKMNQLRFLSLEGSQITDDGLSLLTEMEHLEQLFLDRTAVTDQGMETICNFPSIIALSLSHTLITDKTLHLIGDPIVTRFTRDIRSLNVAGCQVTNKGVQSLKHMINLHSLNLDRTRANARCKTYLEGLEYLLPFRVAEVVSGDESSDSSDMDMGADNALI